MHINTIVCARTFSQVIKRVYKIILMFFNSPLHGSTNLYSIIGYLYTVPHNYCTIMNNT
jgi:hypothetical protein